MQKPIYSYVNGTYEVKLFADGTKTKTSESDLFIPIFPDSIDLKITNRCDLNCPMCHESATQDGAHAQLDHPILFTLKEGTELAIGGGNPLCHPQLEELLIRLKKQGVVCNITINERHLSAYKDMLEGLISRKLIYGIGVSVDQGLPEAIEFLTDHPNAVAHVICGLVSGATLKKLKNQKILLLGYKQKGRGKSLYNAIIAQKIQKLKEALPLLLKSFKVVSFDNLAIEQLEVKRQLCPRLFSSFFMGEDGEASMYIDLVNKTCAQSSVSESCFALPSDVISAFELVKRRS